MLFGTSTGVGNFLSQTALEYRTIALTHLPAGFPLARRPVQWSFQTAMSCMVLWDT